MDAHTIPFESVPLAFLFDVLQAQGKNVRGRLIKAELNLFYSTLAFLTVDRARLALFRFLVQLRDGKTMVAA